MTTRRVAVYGGSFDPPHLGHVLSVAWALSAAEIDAVWIIPTWKHAFNKEHCASFEERMSMCELAFAVFRDVEVSDVERRLGGVESTDLRHRDNFCNSHDCPSFPAIDRRGQHGPQRLAS